MIKAVFFDIDGTLVSFGTRSIAPSTQEALRALQKKGIKVCIATGRPPQNTAFLQDCFDFSYDGFVTTNGQYCYCGSRVLRDSCLPRQAVRTVLPYLEQQGIACEFVDLKRTYFNQINDRALRVAKAYNLANPTSLLGNMETICHQDIYQISAFLPEEAEPELLRHLPGCKSARWHPDFTDIIPADGGKTVGIDALLSHFGLSAQECMAFGDGGNDAGMLRHAAVGVAMGNGTPSAKAAADYITDDVDSDGILHALEHFQIL